MLRSPDLSFILHCAVFILNDAMQDGADAASFLSTAFNAVVRQRRW